MDLRLRQNLVEGWCQDSQPPLLLDELTTSHHVGLNLRSLEDPRERQRLNPLFSAALQNVFGHLRLAKH